MSSEAPGGGGDRHGRRASIGNLIKKVKDVVRRKSSTPDTTQTGESSSTGAVATSALEEQPATSFQPAQRRGEPGSPIDVDVSGEDTRVPLPPTRNAAQQDRLRQLLAKYSIELDPNDPLMTNTQQFPDRIHKPIRMRVHRTCHRCKTTFGPDKTCPGCQHRRCTKCPRYPVKKPKKQKAEASTAFVERRDSPEPPPPGPPKRTKRDYTNVHRPARPGVSRFCHKCETQFDLPNQSTCQNCGHNRCTRCLREPMKSKRWPDAYAADEFSEEGDKPIASDRVYRKPKARVKWFCEKCGEGYLANSKSCEKCGHGRCQSCKRVPPQKVRPNISPDVFRAVEAKLAELDLSPLNAPTTVAVTVP